MAECQTGLLSGIWYHVAPGHSNSPYQEGIGASGFPPNGTSPPCCAVVWIFEDCISLLWPWPWFNIKISSYQYRKSHCGDKAVVRSSHLHDVNSYTSKTSSLYLNQGPGDAIWLDRTQSSLVQIMAWQSNYGSFLSVEWIENVICKVSAISLRSPRVE